MTKSMLNLPDSDGDALGGEVAVDVDIGVGAFVEIGVGLNVGDGVGAGVGTNKIVRNVDRALIFGCENAFSVWALRRATL